LHECALDENDKNLNWKIESMGQKINVKHKFHLKDDLELNPKTNNMKSFISFLRWRNYDDTLEEIKEFVNIYNIQRLNWI
jgi:hypothetical protein